MSHYLTGIAASVLLVGCAPSLDHLLETRNYGEAICKATVIDDDPKALARVERRLAREIDPVLSLHAVTPEQLRPLLGISADSVSSRVLLLRGDMRHHHGAFGSLVTWLEWVSPAGVLQPLSGAREAWAALTGERVPEPVVTGQDVSDAAMAAHVAADLTAHVGDFVTLGLFSFTDLVGPAPRSTLEEREQTFEEYRAISPQAAALHEAALSAWPRPTPSDTLRLRYSYSVPSYKGECRIERIVRITLPGNGSLEERINRRFDGQRWIRFEELD